ncbi:MAG: HD domain-containing protein [Patescibacteria group bacterium]|jgi:putative hydrolase of HD superfamily
MDNLEKIFDFLHLVRDLKTTYRYGAQERKKGIHQDSSADHSWRLALMAFIFAEELKLDIDIYKAVKIALVHDLSEAIAGDVDYRLIWLKKITPEDKYKNEYEAMEKIKSTLPAPVGEEILNLWLEFEKGTSREGKFINALDKMEGIAHLIEEGHATYDLPEAIPRYASRAVNNFPELKNAYKIMKRRLKQEFEKGNIEWLEEYEE